MLSSSYPPPAKMVTLLLVERASIVLVYLVGVLLTAPAHAFHSAMLFPDSASVGGGGGLFYNGSPRHKGYTCAACHTGAPGLARLVVTSEPASLLTDGLYTPGLTYAIAVSLAGESRGLDAAVNYNTFGVEVLDTADAPVGTFQNFAGGDMVTTIALDALFARGQNNSGASAWSFEWVAPESGAGPVTFYVSGVDGNGAGAANEPATDPAGDDVMTLRLTAWEPGTRPAEAAATGCSAAPTGAPGWPLLCLCLTLLALATESRRRRSRGLRRRHAPSRGP